MDESNLKVNIRECFAAAPVLPAGYVVSASRIADRRMILAAYRLADLLKRSYSNTLIEGEISSILASPLGFLPSLDHLVRPRTASTAESSDRSASPS